MPSQGARNFSYLTLEWGIAILLVLMYKETKCTWRLIFIAQRWLYWMKQHLQCIEHECMREGFKFFIILLLGLNQMESSLNGTSHHLQFYLEQVTSFTFSLEAYHGKNKIKHTMQLFFQILIATLVYGPQNGCWKLAWRPTRETVDKRGISRHLLKQTPMRVHGMGCAKISLVNH